SYSVLHPKNEKDQMASPETILYPGSFDPITLGHVDVIQRLSLLFPKVFVLIGDNPRKSYVLSQKARIDLVKRTIKQSNVEVISSGELTVNVANKLNIPLIARSIRTVTDWEYEYAMAYANRKLAPNVETFFIMA